MQVACQAAIGYRYNYITSLALPFPRSRAGPGKGFMQEGLLLQARGAPGSSHFSGCLSLEPEAPMQQ